MIDWQPATSPKRRRRCHRCRQVDHRSRPGWLMLDLRPPTYLCPDCAELLACTECGQPIGPVSLAHPRAGEPIHILCLPDRRIVCSSSDC